MLEKKFNKAKLVIYLYLKYCGFLLVFNGMMNILYIHVRVPEKYLNLFKHFKIASHYL